MISLRHPHICNIYGVCFLGTAIWIILPLSEHGDLGKFLLVSNQQVPWSLQRKFIIQTTSAVNYLHVRKQPILHRDIKSSNFLLETPEKLVLTDFGTSKFKKNTLQTRKYTLNWAAPEVLQLPSSWTEKADIWSLGMVFFEIVSQSLPFNDKSGELELLAAIQAEERPNIPSSCPEVFSSLSKYIRPCKK